MTDVVINFVVFSDGVGVRELQTGCRGGDWQVGREYCSYHEVVVNVEVRDRCEFEVKVAPLVEYIVGDVSVDVG